MIVNILGLKAAILSIATQVSPEHLCILVPVALWYLICTNFLKWCRKCTLMMLFGTNLHSIIYVGTAPSNGSVQANLVSNISTKA